MNTYRVVNINSFPEFTVGESKIGSHQFTLPGFLEEAKTQLKFITKDYYGFEYYEAEHEMIIKDYGIAFGFYNGEAIQLEFSGYKKTYTIKVYYNRELGYALFSESTPVIRDFIRTIKNDVGLKIKIEELELDLNKAAPYVEEFRSAWFKGVSSRVTSSALFGADLKNEPLFDQLQSEGANLTSIGVPFDTFHIHISTEAGIYSQQKITSISEELSLIVKVKDTLIDKILK